MARFNYDDIVRIKAGRMGSGRGRAWIVAIIDDRQRFPLREFPPGTVYSIEFEDGDAIDVHEDDLEASED
jgi:hypothetical protein